MNLFLDIETIPAQRPDVLADIRESCKSELETALAAVKAPANYKDADKIAEYIGAKQRELTEAHEATVEATYRKTGLDGAFGQVCVIGWAMDDDEPQVRAGLDESALLKDFYAALRDIPASEIFQTTVIGHNVASFDLRFIAQRSIVNGVRPHPVISRSAQAKPWESEKVFDTMVQWAGPGSRISLDKLCRALSIASPKTELDGSKVWDYVRDGRIAEVQDYCKRDVQAVRSVFWRMTFQLPKAA
jgi:hypothetical protein